MKFHNQTHSVINYEFNWEIRMFVDQTSLVFRQQKT